MTSEQLPRKIYIFIIHTVYFLDVYYTHLINKNLFFIKIYLQRNYCRTNLTHIFKLVLSVNNYAGEDIWISSHNRKGQYAKINYLDVVKSLRLVAWHNVILVLVVNFPMRLKHQIVCVYVLYLENLRLFAYLS